MNREIARQGAAGNGARLLGIALAAACCTAGLSPIGGAGAVSQPAVPAQGPTPEVAAVRLVAEALARIRQQAAFLTDQADPEDMAADLLNAYLARRDAFSDYLSPREYAQLKKTRQPNYAGIGLEIEKRRDGAVLCFPYADGPAARGGIRAGDRLLAIGGLAVEGRSLATLAAAAVGEAGAPVTVRIAARDGRSRTLTIEREALGEQTIVKEALDATPVIRFVAFTPGTRQALAQLLSTWSAHDPLILDLRDNTGGDLHAAIDAAALFLPQGDPIASVRSRDGIQTYASTAAGARPAQRVFIWQNGTTASAAEVFVAALTENGRATSIGQKSFGKGTRQDVVELSSGAALILTTGYLRTPRGKEFDGRGLDPSYAVPGESAAAYLARTRALMDAGGARRTPARRRIGQAVAERAARGRLAWQ